MNQQARIEYISQPKQSFNSNNPFIKREGNPRIKLFVFTFLVSLIIGLIINYSRPSVYQSSATLLTSAATAVDQASRNVDFQNVTIQKQKLLGAELLTETLRRINALDTDIDLSKLTLGGIRNMLYVKPIEETNLLDMSAKGSDPELLPLVINTWIDVYLEARALSVKNAANNTVGRVKSELQELETKIELTRNEIDLFRKAHDISSITREENELPATLISLTKAFNNANEEVLKTKAKLDAIKKSIANGQAVVPKQEQTSLSDLEKEYRELTAKLAEFDKHFTRDYLQYKGSLKYIPEQIKKLERQIRQKKETGKNIVWTEANQNYYAAKQVVENIRIQLDAHKSKAADFTTLFSKHQKLVDDLESMELLTRETQDRLVQIESKQFEKYPQVDVVERASVNFQAISPNYYIGLLIVFITSLGLSFFIVWFKSYLLQGQEQDQQENSSFPMATWFGDTQQEKIIKNQTLSDLISQRNQNGLPQIATKQIIAETDVQVLLSHSDKNTQLLILLLLSGLDLDEITHLELSQIDTELSVIELAGASARHVTIGKALLEVLNLSLQDGALWERHETLSVDEINAMLYCSAVDNGLNNFDSSLAETLRQSYIIYLVEQGLRLTQVSKIVGYLSPIELASYAAFSPAGDGQEIEQIKIVYPLCD